MTRVQKPRNSPSAARTAARLAAQVSGKHMIKPGPSPRQRNQVNRRKPRRKPGTLALREIRKYQASYSLQIPKAPFVRLIREIGDDAMKNVNFTEGAKEALHEAAEAHLVQLYELANLLALHAHRVTLQPRDLQLVQTIRSMNLLDYRDAGHGQEDDERPNEQRNGKERKDEDNSSHSTIDAT